MRFHALMLLRDEEDILPESLTHLLTWVDALHIYDLGSTDATWDIVQDFAARDRRVIPYKREPTVYADSLRSVLFAHCRDRFETGDWVAKVDADELYGTPPPTFVRERVQPFEGIVYLQWYFFRLTSSEVAGYRSGSISLPEDRRRPISERRRFYKVSRYSEPRLFRYRESMRWPAEQGWPYNAGIIARERIPIRHYPHRDTLQMKRRFQLRSAIMSLGGRTGDHWRLADWQGDVVNDAGTTAAAAAGRKEGLSGENGIDSGPLLYWQPGTTLPEASLYEAPAPFLRRIAQRVAYRCFVPWIDRRRSSYDSSYRPELIAEDQNRRITRNEEAEEQVCEA